MEDQRALAAILDVWRIFRPMHQAERDAMFRRLRRQTDGNEVRRFIDEIQEAFFMAIDDSSDADSA